MNLLMDGYSPYTALQCIQGRGIHKPASNLKAKNPSMSNGNAQFWTNNLNILIGVSLFSLSSFDFFLF